MFYCCCSLTVTWIQDLHRGGGRELHHSHHRLWQQNLEGLGLLVLPVRQYADPPRGFGLSRVELDLSLGLSLKVLIRLRTAVLGANAWESVTVWHVSGQKRKRGKKGRMIKKRKKDTEKKKTKTNKEGGRGKVTGRRRSADEREIRYSHPLMLLRRRWGTECCVLFSFTDHSRSLGSVWNEFETEAFK